MLVLLIIICLIACWLVFSFLTSLFLLIIFDFDEPKYSKNYKFPIWARIVTILWPLAFVLLVLFLIKELFSFIITGKMKIFDI